ncbi:hypothetical protein MHYP_G00323650 [Metynnis hypsauchen]
MGLQANLRCREVCRKLHRVEYDKASLHSLLFSQGSDLPESAVPHTLHLQANQEQEEDHEYEEHVEDQEYQEQEVEQEYEEYQEKLAEPRPSGTVWSLTEPPTWCL